MRKYKDYIIIIIILSLIVISLTVLSSLNKDKQNDNNQILINYKVEEDYSKFFTVNSCIYKYIEYLTKKDTTNILKVLNEDYVKNNNINNSNLYNYLDNLNGIYTFSAKKMYKDDTDDLVKYYVYGYLVKETINGSADKTEKYFILNLDENNLTFDIMPSDSKTFSEVENG